MKDKKFGGVSYGERIFQSNSYDDFIIPPCSCLEFLFYILEGMLLDVPSFIFYISLVI